MEIRRDQYAAFSARLCIVFSNVEVILRKPDDAKIKLHSICTIFAHKMYLPSQFYMVELVYRNL